MSDQAADLLGLSFEESDRVVANEAQPQFSGGEDLIDLSSNERLATADSNKDRHEQLLGIARQEREAFVSQPDGSASTPEVDGDSASEKSDISAELNELPDGFAFPVTKKIITFLGRFSSTASTSGRGAPLSDQEESSSDDGKENEKLVSSERESVGSDNSNDAPQKPLERSKSLDKVESERIPSREKFERSKSARVPSISKGTKGKGKNNNSYKKLLDKLKDPVAVDILNTIRVFVLGFLAEGAYAFDPPVNELSTADTWDGDYMPGQDNEDAQKVQLFLRKLEQKARVHKLWRGEKEDEWDQTVEGLEKFVMCKIEKKAFQPSKQFKHLDLKIKQRIQALSFLSRDHLEIRQMGAQWLPIWQKAGAELSKINHYRSPRDKIVCILNCCRVITTILKDSAAEQGDKLPGADEFLPALIYVILKANPENMHSNIEYIAAYRNPSRLTGEPGYFFTHLTSAVAFIQRLDESMLAINKAEFESGVAHCKEKMLQDPEFTYGWNGIPVVVKPDVENNNDSCQENIMPRTNMICDDEAQDKLGALGEVLTNVSHSLFDGLNCPPTEPGALEKWKSERMRFATKSAGDLRLNEIEDLLAEYKTLCGTVSLLLNK